MKKVRLSVYLEPAILARLEAYADRRGKPKSLLAEAAIASYTSPDATERLEAALSRRLDRLARQNERLERDLSIAIELSALFVRFWLNTVPVLPENARATAETRGAERYQQFMEVLGRRLSRGRGLADEVSKDVTTGRSAIQPE